MSFVGLTACEDAISIGELTLGTADLLILPLQAGSPPPSAVSLWVTNGRGATQLLSHPDATLTPYLRISFPTGTLASLDGESLGPTDSAFVTVGPRSGLYGLTLSPTGLTFTAASRPVATLFVARYGDFRVADGSPTYASRDAYAAALDIWEEVGLDRWRIATSSRLSGPDEVSAAVQAGGAFVVAAPR